MFFLLKLIKNYKNKKKKANILCNHFISKTIAALQEREQLFLPDCFADPCDVSNWLSSYALLSSQLNSVSYSITKKSKYFNVLRTRRKEFLNYYDSIKTDVENHNSLIVKTKLPIAYSLIGHVETRELDKQQMSSIVKDFHNHLVIAGAGTGKTTTVIGKIKYLLAAKKYSPDEILVLSFTRKSADEMRERIYKETNCRIDAMTFHKLGLRIIASVNGIMPKISQVNLRSFIEKELCIRIKSDEYLYLLTKYILYNSVISRDEFSFSSQAEYDEYIKTTPPMTFNKRKVKSYGEMDIANFLYENNIDYIYEYPYEIDTRTDSYTQYQPDFYLPNYDIYIEYFGIDKKGNVPSYFQGKNEKSATEIYQDSMNWKRELHKKHGTTLIETYAYEKFDGVLLNNLKEKLSSHGIVFNPKTPQELWGEMDNDKNSVISSTAELFETIINLLKSNNLTINDAKDIVNSNPNTENNLLLLYLVEPIFNAYSSYLKERDEIDFNDMINIASHLVNEGKYISKYKYVIIDEYQDISKSRFELLMNLRKSNYYDLFCVGDDWQSIYRFTGSDISYILNFEKYWGPAETSKIETTYRFNQDLISISGNFIMQNSAQIKKSILGKPADFYEPSVSIIKGYAYAITKELNFLPKNSKVFFIGRYAFDCDKLKDFDFFNFRYNIAEQSVHIKYLYRPDLKISFLTAHKSKGLQADYVFVLNNKADKLGFPSKIQNAHIIELLLDSSDKHPFSEERRLFYVALTRAEKRVFLLTEKDNESIFISELRRTYGDLEPYRKCPLCGGNLVKKSGQYGEFVGCSNFKFLGCSYKKQI